MTARLGFIERWMRVAVAAASATALVGTALLLPQSAGAQISIISTAPYSQNFDTLANTGSTNTWQNDSTLKGWYVQRASSDVATYAASDGTPGTPVTVGLFSFGSTDATDRALGVVNNGTIGTVYYGVRMKNDTGAAISKFAVSYTGEQWRDGGSDNENGDDLDFGYRTGSSVTSPRDGTWTDANSLDFDSPAASAVGSARALDGNAPENRVAKSATVTLATPLAAGEEIMFRWVDVNHGGGDHGLGVDDLTITPILAGPAPILTQCPATVTAFAGSSQTVALAARDADSIVVNAASDAALPTGVTIGNVVPATSVGGTLTADLTVDTTATPGEFNVPITFSNQDSPAQTASCTVRVVIEAAATDLTLRKDGPTSYRPGTQIVYVLTIATGADPATNLVLNDTLPDGISYVSDDSGVTPTINGQTLTWNLPGTLPASSVLRVELTTLVAGNTRADLVNQANVTSAEVDSNPNNNSASSPTATQFQRAANFSGSGKTVSSRVVSPGDPLTFTITISNSGDIAATYVLTDVLDDDLTLVSAPGITVNGQELFATGSITGGEQKEFVVTTRIKPKATGTVYNNAFLTGDGQTRKLSSPSVQIRPRMVLIPIIMR